MRTVRVVTTTAYLAAILLLVWRVVSRFAAGESGDAILREAAYYLPTLAAVFVASLQVDYLESIAEGGRVNIKARVIDFVHWLMLVSIGVSTWLSGSTSVSWSLLQILVLTIIGFSIGLGVDRDAGALLPKDIQLGLIAGVLALGSGALFFWLRQTHAADIALSTGSRLTYGWLADSIAGVISVILAAGFILADLKVIRTDYRGYPRKLFLKGIFGCNALILMSWLEALLHASEPSQWALENFGFSFNAIVGNLVYLYYYGVWEIERIRQSQ